MRGFTLLEILLSLSLITFISLFSLVVYINVPLRNDLSTSAYSVQEAMRRASFYASSGYYDSSWGVRIEETRVVVFKGDSYANRDTAFDTETLLPISPLGDPQEYIFQRVSGLPNHPGEILISSPALTESKTVTINEKGLVTF